MQSSARRAAAVTATALATLMLLPATAFACGGFFCFTQPVDQSAERVLYIHDNDKITVHIQISYTGDDEKFSWVLPLMSVPELGVGSDSVFQILEQQTTPRFNLQWQNDKDCYGYTPCDYDNGSPTAGGTGQGGGGVVVLKEEKVGPYDTVVVKGDSAAELIKWLNDNGYVQPKETEPLVDLYVKDKYIFLALKLQKDSSAGDLAPIVVTLDETESCLPIRLTKLAAQPDMPIVTWTLGKHRAIPKNFLHVVLNEATIDWLAPGTNYKTVVSKAVDQASGHAFTTEYAKKIAAFGAKFYNKQWDATKLATLTDPTQFMQKLMEDGWPRTTQMQQLLKKHMPKPDKYKDVSDQEFYNCIQNAGGSGNCADYKAAIVAQGFDPAKFAKDLGELIAAPLEKVQAAFDTKEYLTRLYTTVDASEMTKDPIFAFNKDLPEVDNQHSAKAFPICKDGNKQAHEAKIVFADGHELVQAMPKDSGSCANFDGTAAFGKGTAPLVKAGGQPALLVQVIDETGAPIDIHPDAADKVDAALNDAKAGKPSLTEDFLKTLPDPKTWDARKTEYVPPKPAEDAGSTGAVDAGGSGGTGTTTGGGQASGSSSGCSAGTTGQTAPFALLLLCALALLPLWRRRQA